MDSRHPLNLRNLAGALAILFLLQVLSGSYCYVAGKEGLKSIKISDLNCLRRAKGDAALKKQYYRRMQKQKRGLEEWAKA